MISLSDLQFVGHGLCRPECVLATSDGILHVADWRGGVTTIAPDGTQVTVLANGDFRPKPNGIAIHPTGGWLIAHLGDTTGGIFHLATNGDLSLVLLEIDGVPLPPTNYVHIDDAGRIWVTVSTRKSPRSLGYRADCDDGFIVLVDANGARIVADGLGYTNECVIHPISRQLYVNETFARRLTRFDVKENGDLINKSTISKFGPGTYPDGLTFDSEGCVLVTSIVSNRGIRGHENGTQEELLEDHDPDLVTEIEEAFLADRMSAKHLSQSSGKHLKNISSAAFGGADLRTVFLGCLLGDCIAKFQHPCPGLAPSHWHWRAGSGSKSGALV